MIRDEWMLTEQGPINTVDPTTEVNKQLHVANNLIARQHCMHEMENEQLHVAKKLNVIQKIRM